MKQDILALSLGFGALLTAWHPAYGQSARNCAPHAAIVERLEQHFGEQRQSIGLSSNGQVVEVFASLTSGSWTIVVSTTAGQSCVVAAGEAFENLAERPTPNGAPV